MTEAIGTLNEDGIGEPSTPVDQPNIDPDATNIIGTVEDPEPGDLEAGAGKPSEGTLKTDDGGEAGKDGTDGQDKELPFHNHPRWKEVMAERDKARAEIEAMKAELSVLKTVVAPRGAETKGEEPKGEPEYKDITTMTTEELAEWQAEDPKGYAANLYAQIRAEMRAEQAQEQAQAKKSQSIRETYDKYVKDNPDFTQMWQSGEIKKYMDQNPGHTAISAHMAMTQETRIKEAAEKAAKEAEKKVLENFKAKRSAQVLGGGPAVAGGVKEDNELNDTKKHGGFASIAAKRIQRLRQAGGR